MPDLEHMTRSLELHLTKTPEQAAYVRGKHHGQDAARKEVAWIALGLAVLAVAIGVALA